MKHAAILLADPSPCLRRLVLLHLYGRDSEDVEVRELDPFCLEDPLVLDLIHTQEKDGSWTPGILPGSQSASRLITTSRVLMRFGFLGFDSRNLAVRRGVDYIYSRQEHDGKWPIGSEGSSAEDEAPYDMMPMQTAIPLRGLVMCGEGQDERCELAYKWLLAQRLDDGAWPVGTSSGVNGYIAGYRRLAHSRWGCRSNTTAVLACLAFHPVYSQGSEARRALDLLLGRETRETYALGFETARLIGAEETRGFTTTHARFDLAQMIDFCWRIGAILEDDRVKSLVDFVVNLRGENGLWEYKRRRQASRWVSFDLLRSLANLNSEGDWISQEPRTPFIAYIRKRKRF